MNVIRVEAKILLYKDGRKTPFGNGYKPLFQFIEEMRISGQISLKDRNEFFPGEEGIVEIAFLESDGLGESFGVGSKFIFDEGVGKILGEGVIVSIL